MTPEITRVFEASTETAQERFAHTTRSASFNLSFGIREIRMLRTRPWDDDRSMEGVDLTALQRLFEKGLVEMEGSARPRLTAAGKLVRQLLVYSRHIEPTYVLTTPVDVLRVLKRGAALLAKDFAGQLVMQKFEERLIDGELNLVVRINEGMGNYAEWAIPKSAVRRIG